MQLSSCLKTPDGNPKIGQLAAFVDSEAWESCRPNFTREAVRTTVNENYLHISGGNLCDSNSFDVGFALQAFSEDSFVLDTTHRGFVEGPEWHQGKRVEFSTTADHTGYVVITEIDTENQEVSGYFAFQAFSTELGEIRSVERGRFDRVRY